ncbi:MAG TPA: hypothetical protein VK348_11720 [Planctomycetota bacterium]|nr:hypothetical protein [Planctomycetota bacterium]
MRVPAGVLAVAAAATAQRAQPTANLCLAVMAAMVPTQPSFAVATASPACT